MTGIEPRPQRWEASVTTMPPWPLGFFYEPELQLAYIGSDILYKKKFFKKEEKRWRGGGISEMEGMAYKVQLMDSRKRSGKYIEH